MGKRAYDSVGWSLPRADRGVGAFHTLSTDSRRETRESAIPKQLAVCIILIEGHVRPSIVECFVTCGEFAVTG